VARRWPSLTAPLGLRPHVALAIAAAAQYLGWQEEPLDDRPAVDGERVVSPAWAAESERYLTERDALIGDGGPLADRPAQEAALATLRSDPHARAEAVRAVRRRYGEGVLPIDVHVWGPGWRDVPSVVIGGAGQVK
jgi:hypothetical protein